MKSYKKSTIFGAILGVVFVFISTLGLVVGMIEFLRPVLSPGTELLRGRVDMLPFNPLLLGLVLNAFIYILLFTSISFARRAETKQKRIVGVVSVLVVYFALTGMFGEILALLTSSDPLWIFRVGA
ncbi:MAG: hypothetical protein WDZ88_01085 [Candidatus Paceibacterota bacterium]